MRGKLADEPDEVEVLACNWTGVQVYMRCQQTMLAGMGGGALLGLSAQEVYAACRLSLVPRAEWPEACDVAQSLAAHVAKIENDKAASKARASKSRASKG